VLLSLNEYLKVSATASAIGVLGGVTPDECCWLAGLVKNCEGGFRPKVLEVGTCSGKSALVMSWFADEVVTLDIESCPVAKENWEKYKAGNIVQLKLPHTIPPGPYDVLFIDGEHTKGAVIKDIRLYYPLLEPGGLVMFHDVKSHPAVRDGIVQMFGDMPIAECGGYVHKAKDPDGLESGPFYNNIAFCRKPQ